MYEQKRWVLITFFGSGILGAWKHLENPVPPDGETTDDLSAKDFFFGFAAPLVFAALRHPFFERQSPQKKMQD